METATTIHTISEYLAWIKDCYDGPDVGGRPLFFRGHADQNWELLPSILRDNKLNEKGLILDYKQVFALEPNYPENVERILVEMQHHCIPTRLLDWSISPLIALFFACADKTNKWGTVYCLNPWIVYKESIQNDTSTFYFEIMKECRLLLALGRTIEEIQDHCIRKYGYSVKSSELDIPLPIVGRHINQRVVNQQGCFVLWGNVQTPLVYFSLYKNYIFSCRIPKRAKQCLLTHLSQLGINYFNLFGDYEGFAKVVKQKGGIFRL